MVEASMREGIKNPKTPEEAVWRVLWRMDSLRVRLDGKLSAVQSQSQTYTTEDGKKGEVFLMVHTPNKGGKDFSFSPNDEKCCDHQSLHDRLQWSVCSKGFPREAEPKMEHWESKPIHCKASDYKTSRRFAKDGRHPVEVVDLTFQWKVKFPPKE
jgi:hypothetical protein